MIETPKALAAAMAKAFAEIEGATKAAAGQVGQQKYKYADLTSVIDAIKPALVNNGLFFTQRPEPSDRGVCIETALHHASGESMSLGKLFVPANKQDAQGFGSALTYARRYALVTAFGVPVEDDDGSAAVASVKSEQHHQKQVALITDDQRTELMNLLDHLNVNPKAFFARGNITDLRELPATHFTAAKKWINDTALAQRDAELKKNDGAFAGVDASEVQF